MTADIGFLHVLFSFNIFVVFFSILDFFRASKRCHEQHFNVRSVLFAVCAALLACLQT